jgi:hypothetical protein
MGWGVDGTSNSAREDRFIHNTSQLSTAKGEVIHNRNANTPILTAYWRITSEGA